jgi:uncharacterized membrane protein
MVFFFAFLIGVFSGLRALTPPAAVAWGAYLGWLKLQSPLSFIGSLPSVIIFTLLAVGELINDKLPKTPARTATPSVIVRALMGALAGACIAVSGGQGIAVGAVLGAIGSLVGTFGGYKARTGLVKTLGTKDLNIALLEDLITIAGSLWIASRF